MIEFHTTLNAEKTSAVNKHQLKRMAWFFVVVSAILIGVGIVGIVAMEDDSDLAAAVFCLVFGVLFTPLVFLLTHIIQKRYNKSAVAISATTDEIYTFDEEKFTVKQQCGDIFTSVFEAKYSYIYKATETADYIFLNVSKQQFHVIDKKSLVQGSLAELNALLTSRLGDKFKCKKQ